MKQVIIGLPSSTSFFSAGCKYNATIASGTFITTELPAVANPVLNWEFTFEDPLPVLYISVNAAQTLTDNGTTVNFSVWADLGANISCTVSALQPSSEPFLVTARN